MSAGCQHHDRRSPSKLFHSNALDQRKSIHLGHMHVGQDEPEWVTDLARLFESFQRHFAIGCQRRIHAPVCEQTLQYPAVGSVVVHDQDACSLQHSHLG